MCGVVSSLLHRLQIQTQGKAKLTLLVSTMNGVNGSYHTKKAKTTTETRAFLAWNGRGQGIRFRVCDYQAIRT